LHLTRKLGKLATGIAKMASSLAIKDIINCIMDREDKEDNVL
jgi:hypothetical protein